MKNLSDFNLAMGFPSSNLRWHCEPKVWSIEPEAGELKIKTDSETDFWQRTHYGFEADTGHFLYLQIESDFVATTKVTAPGRHQYDQAGLMLRLSKTCWIKTSIEFEPMENNRLGVVVTNHQYSDWSTQSITKDVETIWLRFHVKGQNCIVSSSYDGLNWQQLRMAHLSERVDQKTLFCGVYACSPKNDGFEARFHFFDIQPTT
jgi:regulation of enolase protein 1 (concanavalin A-like superfamily)